MKQLISILIILALVFSFSSCDTSQNEQNLENAITIRNAEIYNDYAVLSLCEVLNNLGFRLERNGNDIATFICNGIEYEISISDRTLTKKGADDNYLICAPGNEHFVCNASNGDLLVDDNTVMCLFQTFLEYPIQIFIDRDNNCVMIVKQ